MKIGGFEVEEIISYTDMTSFERMSLQHGMNFREDDSVFLMSRRPGAPYEDSYDLQLNMMIYEGHDEPRRMGGPPPKSVDQPLRPETRNRKFFDAAQELKSGERARPLQVRIYEKLKPGIWVFNGTFALDDAWTEEVGGRNVCKFGMSLLQGVSAEFGAVETPKLSHNRMIPSTVKQEVFRRDGGKCVLCGSRTNLHFDHDLPFTRGGTSLIPENIRLLCATHNLRKGAKIE